MTEFYKVEEIHDGQLWKVLRVSEDQMLCVCPEQEYAERIAHALNALQQRKDEAQTRAMEGGGR